MQNTSNGACRRCAYLDDMSRHFGHVRGKNTANMHQHSALYMHERMLRLSCKTMPNHTLTGSILEKVSAYICCISTPIFHWLPFLPFNCRCLNFVLVDWLLKPDFPLLNIQDTPSAASRPGSQLYVLDHEPISAEC